MKKLFYPAVFIPEDDGGFSVFFPDIPGCNTCGNTIEQAYEMAFEALGLVLTYMEDNKEPIPSASKPQDVKLEEGQFLAVIEFDMNAYKRKTNSRAVKKTLTIPSWLNDIALEKNVNFSQVLQDALMVMLESRQKPTVNIKKTEGLYRISMNQPSSFKKRILKSKKWNIKSKNNQNHLCR